MRAQPSGAIGDPPSRDELELLTPEELAELFKVPLSWVRSATRSRSPHPIPHVKIGHYVRFEEEAVREWFHKQKRGYRPKRLQ